MAASRSNITPLSVVPLSAAIADECGNQNDKRRATEHPGTAMHGLGKPHRREFCSRRAREHLVTLCENCRRWRDNCAHQKQNARPIAGAGAMLA
jgi:hypothetical protein